MSLRHLPVLLAVAVAALLGACGDDGDEATSTSTTTEAATTGSGSSETAPSSSEAATTTTEAAPTATASSSGPQVCGTVTTTVGAEVTVEIVAGEVDCAFAEGLLDTYYNAPPVPPEGSGAFVTMDGWECNSSASQEPGRASTCRLLDGEGEVIARG